MPTETALIVKKEGNGKNLISYAEAIRMLIAREVSRLGFKKATFVDLEVTDYYYEMVYGWFDLLDQDHQAKLVKDDLVMEIWLRGTEFPETAVVETRELIYEKEQVSYHQTKLNTKITKADLDYVTFNGTRYYVEG